MEELIKFGLYTGQRLADLATLTWSQIDLSRNEIRLTTRKTGKKLVIPLADPLREHMLSLPAGDKPRSPVHPRACKIIHARSERVGMLSRQFSELLASAGLRQPRTHKSRGVGRSGKRQVSELSFHSLRRTAVSLLKDAGVPDAVVQALVGHEYSLHPCWPRVVGQGREVVARAMTTAGPKLTAEQIESQFKPLLARFVADLEATATDAENLWALRRKMAKTLSYQERGTPIRRRNLAGFFAAPSGKPGPSTVNSDQRGSSVSQVAALKGNG